MITRNKYRAIKSKVAGVWFDSKLEGSVYRLLLERKKSKEIEILKMQDRIALSAAKIIYIPDFKCLDLRTGGVFWVEAKGFESKRWPTIKRLWKAYGPGPLMIYKGTYHKPILQQTILGGGERVAE